MDLLCLSALHNLYKPIVENVNLTEEGGISSEMGLTCERSRLFCP